MIEYPLTTKVIYEQLRDVKIFFVKKWRIAKDFKDIGNEAYKVGMGDFYSGKMSYNKYIHQVRAFALNKDLKAAVEYLFKNAYNAGRDAAKKGEKNK